MPQTIIVPTNLPSFPWEVGDPLDAIPLNNAFIQLHQLVDNLQGQIIFLEDQLQTHNLGFQTTISFGGNSTPTAGPYTLMASAPYDFIITSIDVNVGDNGGSFGVTILINNVPIDGLTDITVDQFMKTNFMPTGIVTVLRGSLLTMNIANITDFPKNSYVAINGTTNALPVEVVGVGIAVALGQSNATANALVIAVIGQGFAFASGKATVSFIGQSANLGVARSSGIATGNMHGVAVLIGGATADALGTSTAQATGVSQTLDQHVLVMDDPLVGILNTNPLG